MNTLSVFGVLFLLNICAMTTGDNELTTTNFTNKIPNHIPYPTSIVDLIANFFKTYKHIKRLTLFLCADSSTRLSASIPIPTDYNPITASAQLFQQIQNDELKLKQQLECHENCCLNFQQIVKYLMASGNFLIKGDGNIDATMFTTIDNGCNMDAEYGKLKSGLPYTWLDMLKSGDFKQGVVLDLRCRQSQHILQQVKQ